LIIKINQIFTGYPTTITEYLNIKRNNFMNSLEQKKILSVKKPYKKNYKI